MVWTGIKLTNEQLKKYSWLHGFKRPPKFLHHRLNKLSPEQRQNFQHDLENIFIEIGVSIHSQNRIPSNEKVMDKLKSLNGHVKKIWTQLDLTLVNILIETASDNEAEKVIEFRNLLLLISTLTNRSLKRKIIKASAANIADIITLQTYYLLIKYDIKPTLTKAGAWEKLIEYLADNHSLTLPTELKNSIRRVSKRCKTTEE